MQVGSLSPLLLAVFAVDTSPLLRESNQCLQLHCLKRKHRCLLLLSLAALRDIAPPSTETSGVNKLLAQATKKGQARGVSNPFWV